MLLEYDKNIFYLLCQESKVSAGSFCIVPINAKYYSDNVAIIPIMGYITI